MITLPALTPLSLSRRENILSRYKSLILDVRALDKEIESMLSSSGANWMVLERQRRILQQSVEPLIQDYWHWIPKGCLSRCPFCDEDLWRLFDPVDLSGFWWIV